MDVVLEISSRLAKLSVFSGQTFVTAGGDGGDDFLVTWTWSVFGVVTVPLAVFGAARRACALGNVYQQLVEADLERRLGSRETRQVNALQAGALRL